MELNADQYLRYSRHLILPSVGIEGQKRLLKSSALIVGAGGLGSPAALYLAAAGLGVLGLLDSDEVEAGNLQRQILHSLADIGAPKVESGARRIRSLNPDVRVVVHPTRLTSQNALEILAPYDVILDGSDNFPTRYLLNDACGLLRKPLVHGSIYRFEGQAAVFHPAGGPCYRCLFPEPPPPGETPSCAEGGVFGVLPGVIGAIQATECLKLLLGAGEPLAGRLLVYNALQMSFREIRMARDPGCALCGDSPTIRSLVDYEEFCGLGDERAAQGGAPRVAPRDLKRMLDRGEGVFLLDVRLREEAAIGAIEGSVNIPLEDLATYLPALARQREKKVVAYCHWGLRSQAACRYLLAQGFADVANLAGGIHAWSRDVDSSIPLY